MPTSNDQRPDPDLLLAKVKQQEAQARRGKLRIYFGSAAGVGKTYAMLVAARKLVSEGHAVLVGVVETHGRAETAALLEGLEVLPPRTIIHRGKPLTEFDLDAALLRHPQLILIDELAHSNAPGVRHPKRWQDVDEVLAAGIDVFSTLNVQHLESLNDVVGGITNVRVWETVPDKVFDAADEVVLVDIPADELLARLKAGKVYVAHQAERAVNHFFRKGNLMALRELALRRTADRIEGDVQAYRVDQSIESVWKTATALLTCIGPDAGAERVVRAAARTYLISPEALGKLGATPEQQRDRFSLGYLVHLAARAIRDLAVLCGRAEKAGKRVSTMALEVEVRFASAESRNAFAEELAATVAKLAAKYHDESASGGRKFRFFGGVYPVITREEPVDPQSIQIQ